MDIPINKALVENRLIKVMVVIDKDINGLLVEIVFINKILEEKISIPKISLRIIDSKIRRDTRVSS